MMQLINRLADFLIASAAKRPPDFVIGEPEAPYLLRWWLIPRNRFFNLYLHHFLRSDDPRALHDHPFANCSIVLRGSYLEVMPEERLAIRTAGDVVFRRAASAHRVELAETDHMHRPKQVWSLFITGPGTREWGFLCPKGWRHWKDFTSFRDVGEDGRGRIGLGCE